MDAEMVRDYALLASGLLSDTIGGPSVKPYQPPGVWEAVGLMNSNTRTYQQDPGEAVYRRSMYTLWKRSAPPASMEVFNAPSREVCTVTRERTNTPLQALVTLNDPQFVEAARRLAELACIDSLDSTDRLQFMAARLLSRPLHAGELKILEDSLRNFEQHYASNAENAALLVEVGDSKPDTSVPVQELATWTMVANLLMNLDEVLNK